MRKKLFLNATIIFILALLLLPLSAYTQSSCCSINLSPAGSVTGSPGDTGIYLTSIKVDVPRECFAAGGNVDIGLPEIDFIGPSPDSGAITLTDPPGQFVPGDGTTVTFDIMMELSPDLSPGIYEFALSLNSTCNGELGESYTDSAELGIFTLTVFPSTTPECCMPVIEDPMVSSVDPGSTRTTNTVRIESNCSSYPGSPGSITTSISKAASVRPAPGSGSMNFTLSQTTLSVPFGGSAEVEIIGTFSADLTPGFYEVELTVTASCSDPIYEPRSYSDTKTFTIYVQPAVEDECCFPALGPQLNTASVPGDRVALSRITVSNTCYIGAREYDSRPSVSVEKLDVFPDPNPGKIFLLPSPQELQLKSGELRNITLFAVLTEDVPEDFYQLEASLKVECNSPVGKQEHEITASFTLSVESEKERSFIPGLEIPSSFAKGVCAAPGSTVMIPVNTIQKPEEFKWEGVAEFAGGEKRVDLLAASHRAVVTVVPGGLEGKTRIQISGPGGRSNPVEIEVNESCTSNEGNEVTEEKVREWGEAVPEDLKDRATDRTGQFINFLPGEVIIQFTGTTEQLKSLKTEYGLESLERIPPTDFFVARLEDRGIRNTLETADSLSAEEGVKYATENGLMTLLQEELNDPKVNEQEQLQATNIFTGWKNFFPLKGQGVRIGVVDTGLDLAVKDEVRTSRFAPNGIDVSSGSQNLSLLLGTSTADDRRGHGTIVSGIAAAQGDNEKLGAGIAYNSRVIPIKVFGRSRFTPQDIIAKGLVAGFYLQTDVINMSLGCSRCRPSKERQTRKYFARVLDSLYADFEKRDLTPPIIVAASGNDGEGIVDTPAADPRVIAVGSYNLKKQSKSSFSNYGQEIDFVAPGENIVTTLLGGEFGDAGSGTSFASPQAAGLVALILSTQPKLKDLGVEAVREKIRECFVMDVGEPGFDNNTGWGLIHIPEPEEVDPEKCLIFSESGTGKD